MMLPHPQYVLSSSTRHSTKHLLLRWLLLLLRARLPAPCPSHSLNLHIIAPQTTTISHHHQSLLPSGVRQCPTRGCACLSASQGAAPDPPSWAQLQGQAEGERSSSSEGVRGIRKGGTGQQQRGSENGEDEEHAWKKMCRGWGDCHCLVSSPYYYKGMVASGDSSSTATHLHCGLPCTATLLVERPTAALQYRTAVSQSASSLHHAQYLLCSPTLAAARLAFCTASNISLHTGSPLYTQPPCVCMCACVIAPTPPSPPSLHRPHTPDASSASMSACSCFSRARTPGTTCSASTLSYRGNTTSCSNNSSTAAAAQQEYTSISACMLAL